MSNLVDPMLQSAEEIERLKTGKAADNEKILEFGDDDIVNVKNILDKPFRFNYEGAMYEVEAGDTTQLPGFMAWHFLKKFADYWYRHIERDLKKANARNYNRNDKLFIKLIVQEAKIPKPVAGDRDAVVKLKGNSQLPDDIKEDFESSGEDYTAPEQKLKADTPIPDAEFDANMSEQDKAIEEANANPDAKAEEFPDAKKKDAKKPAANK